MKWELNMLIYNSQKSEAGCHAPGPPPAGEYLWVINANLSANWHHLFLAYLRAASVCEDKAKSKSVF